MFKKKVTIIQSDLQIKYKLIVFLIYFLNFSLF